MATPKRINKIRDYEATRRKLLETVGDILRDTGYAGLKTNNIARRAGKDKALIRYYFQSLSNLQKTYIKENDYWFSFFENFNIPENPGPDALKALFADLMKANFNFFRDNIEMQKIILWQISESNPLMRSVSDQREAEGGKLLGMTDRYFRNSDINFRALIAIILGGTYYLVLHAETNKSTVCGIDINVEKDRQAIVACIEQLVVHAWEQQKLLQESGPDELSEIEQIFRLLRPGSHTGTNASVAKTFGTEAKRLQHIILRDLTNCKDDGQRSDRLQAHISMLTALCGSLEIAGAARAGDAVFVLNIIQEISRPFYQLIPGNVTLPLLFRKTEGGKLLYRWQQLVKKITSEAIDPLLTRIMGLPFLYFLGAETKPSWCEYLYLLEYITGIEKHTGQLPKDERAWMMMLISLGYNHSRFSVWCFGMLQRLTAGKSQDEAITILGEMRLNVLSQKNEPGTSFEPAKPPIAEEISQWIEEELAMLVGSSDSAAGKLRTKLQALQSSYWQKQAGPGSADSERADTLKIMDAKLLILLGNGRQAITG